MSQHGFPERLSNTSKGLQEDMSSQTMEVLVETLTGTAFEITVSPSDTIFDIKSKIYRVEGIPISQQHLVYNLKELEDARSLREQSVCDGAKLRLVLGLRGGPVATRRLPPPEPWHDIERMLASKSGECSSGVSGAGSGCKVTVVVFREGERVNMLRVRENKDGTYSHLDTAKYSSSLSHLAECERDEAHSTGGELVADMMHDNALTMTKMMQLRHRMLKLNASRPSHVKRDIQKTRSEEFLSVASLLDDPALEEGRFRRARLKLSEALSGSILVKREAGEGRGQGDVDTPLAADSLPALHADYGPLVVGESSGWRARGFGSSSQLAGGLTGSLAGGPVAGSSSALHVRTRRSARSSPPLSDALFSSSTSDLEHLKRNRILPALSRHRNREHLHLSDDRLDTPPADSLAPSLAPLNKEVGSERRQRRIDKITEMEQRFKEDKDVSQEKEKGSEEKKKIKIRCAFCKKRLSIATVHTCRCGAELCAPHRYSEVHGCAYDYKGHALDALRRENPLVSAPKLPKI
ncbi:AN1-type zinc finger protein 4 isoform X2 [Pieris rapae]|uniref:AN1-type zinc finger protein 4 isoform X2 n=1 Tax=Pieris rapae TaxID=64459 RepID=UPI001E27C006|nr:AN1-type zinc finger protein 4 isoform X2 [Pieris rapae]